MSGKQWEAFVNTSDLSRALRATIELRISELAALENALELLEHNATEEGCPGRNIGRKKPSPCFGAVYARVCFGCGQTFAQCEDHGGLRSATYQVANHGCPGQAEEVAQSLASSLVVRDADLGRFGAAVQGQGEAEITGGKRDSTRAPSLHFSGSPIQGSIK